MGGKKSHVSIEIDAFPSDEDLSELMRLSWTGDPSIPTRSYQNILSRSLTHICAYAEGVLVGFVNVAWDGGIHAFVLDTSVHPSFRCRSIATRLVRQAAATARERGAEWLHVDHEPHLRVLYAQCGFRPTSAGLIDLLANQ